MSGLRLTISGFLILVTFILALGFGMLEGHVGSALIVFNAVLCALIVAIFLWRHQE